MIKFAKWVRSFVAVENESIRVNWIRNQLITTAKEQSLLDVGCGEGRYRADSAHLNYVGIDIPVYTGTGTHGIHTGSWKYQLDVAASGTNIPFKSESFDVVLCSEVLEHVPDPARLVAECARVVSKGGVIILTAPFGAAIHFAPHFYCTGLSPYWYEWIAGELGLSVSLITQFGNHEMLTKQELLRTIRTMGTIQKFVHGILALPSLLLLARKPKLSGPPEDFSCFGYGVLLNKKKLIDHAC
jgi:ubiquinone/menaquinone biosynthesis C-methylase UbiE